MKKITLLIVAAFLAFAGLVAFARVDDAAWTELEKTYKKGIAAKTQGERLSAIGSLASADRKEAAVLLIDVIDKSSKKIQSLNAEKEKILGLGKDKDIDSASSQKAAELIPAFEVEEETKSAAVDALSKYSDKDAILAIMDALFKNTNPVFKTAVLEAAQNYPTELVSETLVKLLDDRSDLVVSLAAEAVGLKKCAGGVDKLKSFVNSTRAWQLRLAAVEALERLDSLDAVGPIIEAYPKEDGRMREAIVKALEGITRNKFGDNVRLWQDWYGKNKDNLKAGMGLERPAGVGEQKKDYKATYYGMKVSYKRPVFVLDLSMSMSFGITDSERGMPPGVNGGAMPANAKIKFAKEELKKVINELAEDVKFNIIIYSDGVQKWEKDLVPANAKNKKAASDFVDKLVLKGKTNIHDALEMAFNMAGIGATDKNYALGIDAIFFLTDGKPTMGQIQEPSKIAAKVKEWNKLSKIALNTIGLGLEADEKFLNTLATENNGTCVIKKQ